jgi:hypothetical protein
VLLDFGLAKGAAAQSQLAGSSVFGFTPLYAPLEQIRGSGTGPHSDLYALAATLYHLLVGTAPIDALERAQASVNGLPDPLIPPHEANPLLQPAVGEVLTRALALRTNARPVSASEMRTALLEATHTTYDWEQDTVLATHDSVTEPIKSEQISTQQIAVEQNPSAPPATIGRARVRRWALGAAALIGLSLLAILWLRGISLAVRTQATSAPAKAVPPRSGAATTTPAWMPPHSTARSPTCAACCTRSTPALMRSKRDAG